MRDPKKFKGVNVFPIARADRATVGRGTQVIVVTKTGSLQLAKVKNVHAKGLDVEWVEIDARPGFAFWNDVYLAHPVKRPVPTDAPAPEHKEVSKGGVGMRLSAWLAARAASFVGRAKIASLADAMAIPAPRMSVLARGVQLADDDEVELMATWASLSDAGMNGSHACDLGWWLDALQKARDLDVAAGVTARKFKRPPGMKRPSKTFAGLPVNDASTKNSDQVGASTWEDEFLARSLVDQKQPTPRLLPAAVQQYAEPTRVTARINGHDVEASPDVLRALLGISGTGPA